MSLPLPSLPMPTISRVRTGRVATGVFLPLLLVALAACSSADPTPAGPLPSLAVPSLPAVASSVAQGGVPRLIAVSIMDGQVTGESGDIDVKVDTRVRITVLADVTDVLLVENYDARQQVTVNSPAQLEFRLDRAGRFDVVLEKSGLKIATLVAT